MGAPTGEWNADARIVGALLEDLVRMPQIRLTITWLLKPDTAGKRTQWEAVKAYYATYLAIPGEQLLQMRVDGKALFGEYLTCDAYEFTMTHDPRAGAPRVNFKRAAALLPESLPRTLAPSPGLPVELFVMDARADGAYRLHMPCLENLDRTRLRQRERDELAAAKRVQPLVIEAVRKVYQSTLLSTLQAYAAVRGNGWPFSQSAHEARVFEEFAGDGRLVGD